MVAVPAKTAFVSAVQIEAYVASARRCEACRSDQVHVYDSGKAGMMNVRCGGCQSLTGLPVNDFLAAVASYDD